MYLDPQEKTNNNGPPICKLQTYGQGLPLYTKLILVSYSSTFQAFSYMR